MILKSNFDLCNGYMDGQTDSAIPKYVNSKWVYKNYHTTKKNPIKKTMES